MSRIGRAPITLPKAVDVTFSGSDVKVRGPKGDLSRTVHTDMALSLDNGALTVQRPTDMPHHRALHGLTRALLANMVHGVSEGFRIQLEIEGVGYRAEMDGPNLVLIVGYSHTVVIKPPKGIQFEVEVRGRSIAVSGADREAVGQISADIRRVRPPEPYKGKGIKYAGERIRRKSGKTGKT